MIAHGRVRTVRSLSADRQVINFDGRPRSLVKIPDYQIRFGPGLPWHRRGGIEDETACGVPYDADKDFTSLRSYTFDGEMCEAGCFSPHELRLGKAVAEFGDDPTDVTSKLPKL